MSILSVWCASGMVWSQTCALDACRHAWDHSEWIRNLKHERTYVRDGFMNGWHGHRWRVPDWGARDRIYKESHAMTNVQVASYLTLASGDRYNAAHLVRTSAIISVLDTDKLSSCCADRGYGESNHHISSDAYCLLTKCYHQYNRYMHHELTDTLWISSSAFTRNAYPSMS